METRIDKIIADLKGTAQTLAQACDHIGITQDDLALEELLDLDSEIFKCDYCGYWEEVCHKNELGGEYIAMTACIWKFIKIDELLVMSE